MTTVINRHFNKLKMRGDISSKHGHRISSQLIEVDVKNNTRYEKVLDPQYSAYMR